jgi:cytochrome c oxidase cbb3-type subunit 1
MMSIRAVNALAHYTNWVIGHVHSGALGWVGMISFGMMYWMVQNIWKRPLAYPSWASHHFWLATIGIVLYTVSMWAAGLMEGLQWRALNDAGQLANPIFMDITQRLDPFLWLRVIGGGMYLVGAVMMAVNFWQTIRGPGSAAAEPVAVGAD